MTTQEKIVCKLLRLEDKSFSIELVPQSSNNPNESDPMALVARLSSSLVFVSITWHARRNPPWSERCATLELAQTILNETKPAPTILVNLACVGQTTESIRGILDHLMSLGICNIFVVRGDLESTRGHLDNESTSPSVQGDFAYASQLVAYIRWYTGDYFCIGVAGYPERSTPDDWRYLCEKISSGADFIITQIFLDPSTYIKYVQHCRQLDIKVPILPGIMPITSSQSVNLIRKLTKSPVPLKVQTNMVRLNGDCNSIRDYGLTYTRDICLSIGCLTRTFHFFTLNKQDNILSLLSRLKLIK